LRLIKRQALSVAKASRDKSLKKNSTGSALRLHCRCDFLIISSLGVCEEALPAVIERRWSRTPNELRAASFPLRLPARLSLRVAPGGDELALPGSGASGAMTPPPARGHEATHRVCQNQTSAPPGR
jgi:hypothetical protein